MRYFTAEELEKDMLPRLQKLNSYFSSTRKYVMGQHGIGNCKKRTEPDPEARLNALTKNPMTYYRALESEKSKKDFMQLMHRGLGANPNQSSTE